MKIRTNDNFFLKEENKLNDDLTNGYNIVQVKNCQAFLK